MVEIALSRVVTTPGYLAQVPAVQEKIIRATVEAIRDVAFKAAEQENPALMAKVRLMRMPEYERRALLALTGLPLSEIFQGLQAQPKPR